MGRISIALLTAVALTMAAPVVHSQLGDDRPAGRDTPKTVPTNDPKGSDKKDPGNGRIDTGEETHDWLVGRWAIGTEAACGTRYYLFGGLAWESVTVGANQQERLRFAEVNYESIGKNKVIFAIRAKPDEGEDNTFTAIRQTRDRATLKRPALLNGKEAADEVTLIRCAGSPSGWVYGRWAQRIGVLDTCGACGEGDHIAFYEFHGRGALFTGGRGSRRCAVTAWPKATVVKADPSGAVIALGNGTRLRVQRTVNPDEVIIHTDGKKADQFTYYRCALHDTE